MWLTLSEAAELEHKTYSGIKKDVYRNKIEVKKINTDQKCGFEYRVDLASLSRKAQLRAHKKMGTEFEGQSSKMGFNFENLGKSAKEEALRLEQMLLAWRRDINNYESKAEATDIFLRDWNDLYGTNISERTLYRKWHRYQEAGRLGLVDQRSLREKEGTQIPDEAWETFKWWYLDINQRTVAFLYKMLVAHFKKTYPAIELPSETSFRRKVKEIPKPVIEYYRHGKKDWKDKCAYFLKRDYESICSNEFWTSDYHTLDLFARDDITGEVFRPHLVIWTDIRSRKMLSMRLMHSSNSDGVFLAFRDAVKNYGFCENVYVDNGREFLVSDFGGRGRRKTDKNADYGRALLDRLGIRMTNAEVANGRAKVCERQFKVVTDQFARIFETYCGNSPDNRPEGLEKKLRDVGKIPLLSEVEKSLKAYIEGIYNNEPSEAEGLSGRSPNECYQENLIRKKVATKEELEMLLLRTSKAQIYKRNGVYLQFGSVKIYYYDVDLTTQLLGQKVYLRYDSENLGQVSIEDKEGRYIATIKRAVTGGYGLSEDTESIRELKKINKKLERVVKEYKETAFDTIPALSDVLRAEAERRRAENKEIFRADILEPIAFGLEKAVVGQNTGIDLERMVGNARKNKEDK